MGTRENKVEKYFDKRIAELGGITRKWTSPGRDGVPDRIAIINGHVVFVEIKTIGGKLSTAQEREFERLEKHGMKVRTVYGHKGVDMLINALSFLKVS